MFHVDPHLKAYYDEFRKDWPAASIRWLREQITDVTKRELQKLLSLVDSWDEPAQLELLQRLFGPKYIEVIVLDANYWKQHYEEYLAEQREDLRRRHELQFHSVFGRMLGYYWDTTNAKFLVEKFSQDLLGEPLDYGARLYNEARAKFGREAVPLLHKLRRCVVVEEDEATEAKEPENKAPEDEEPEAKESEDKLFIRPVYLYVEKDSRLTALTELVLCTTSTGTPTDEQLLQRFAATTLAKDVRLFAVEHYNVSELVWGTAIIKGESREEHASGSQ